MSEQPDMFTGLEIGHMMAELAADKIGEEWKDKAFDAFCRHARLYRLFTTEDVRDAHPELKVPNSRAWGQVALRAKRAQIVRAKGWVTAKASNVHGNAVTLWEAL